jgi:hypothetical protein
LREGTAIYRNPANTHDTNQRTHFVIRHYWCSSDLQRPTTYNQLHP